MADSQEAEDFYGVKLRDLSDFSNCELVVAAVAHKEYKSLTASAFKAMLNESGAFFDIKGILPRNELRELSVIVERI